MHDLFVMITEHHACMAKFLIEKSISNFKMTQYKILIHQPSSFLPHVSVVVPIMIDGDDNEVIDNTLCKLQPSIFCFSTRAQSFYDMCTFNLEQWAEPKTN